MSLLIVGLDVTIVNVALPSIGHDLHATRVGAAVDDRRLHARAGQPADAVGLDGRPVRPPAHLLSRAWPCSRSARCCAAWRRASASLVVFRMLQAVGGSMLNPVAMSIITNTFTDPKERAQAIGVWGAVVGISHGARAGGRRGAGRRRSAGARSSGSTSPSAWPPSCSPCASSPSRGRPGPGASIRSARSS